jgi:hypothetical protein
MFFHVLNRSSCKEDRSYFCSMRFEVLWWDVTVFLCQGVIYLVLGCDCVLLCQRIVYFVVGCDCM